LVRQWYSREFHSGAPEKFYLAMATIFLGTSIASSLGRAGFNPPTDPRYQTIVMLYWLSIGGLLLHMLPGRQLPWGRTAAMLLVLLMPVGLLYQQSNFDLLAEVRKSTSSKNIELSARIGLPVFKDPRRPANIYTPQYVMHEAFLARNTRLSATQPFAIDTKQDAPGTCQSMRMELRRLSRPALRLASVKLEVDGDRFQRYREVRIYSPGDGQGVLYPTPARDLSLSTLLWEDTMWKGYYQGDLDATSFTLVFDAVLGPDFHCQLNIES
ncbi:MAG: hypothetical protein KDI33_11575, partial [Halioglobus sp.]|nr:hypothetical protein [Halioglobus sp.]